MPHPASWVPARAVARDLLALARRLRLVAGSPEAGSVARLADGSQAITAAVSIGTTTDFPCSFAGGTVTLPLLIIDFHDWFYVAAQTVSGGSTTGTRWLRMAITARCNTPTEEIEGLRPVNVTITAGPAFAWIDPAVSGTPDYQAGIPAFSAREYYWYLVKTEEGIITQTAASTYLPAGTPAIFH